MIDFIAVDRAGFIGGYGRFTRISDGRTLVKQSCMTPFHWGRAQLEFFKDIPKDTCIHRCPNHYVATVANYVGTVGDLLQSLQIKTLG